MLYTPNLDKLPNVVLSKEFLREVRYKALRKRVWYKALDRIERGMVNLTISVVERVKSYTLASELTKILDKLREAMKSAFIRHCESYGRKKLIEVVGIALSFGSTDAKDWHGDESMVRLLALNNFYDPVGWK